MDLSAIEQTVIDGRYKGIPGDVQPLPLVEIASQRWNVLRGDLPFPLAVMKQSALDHNSRWMRAFLDHGGAKIAPHGKTTMCPQLWARQLADGAWGITLATIGQVQIARRFGVNRILLANQLVGPTDLQWLLKEQDQHEEFEFYCLVDSTAGVALLHQAWQAHSARRPIQVLLEGGIPGKRTGCRDLESAQDVARAVKAAEPALALRGVEGFEGVLGKGPEGEQRVGEFLTFLVDVARQCEAAQLFAPGPILLTAGGSAYYDMVTERFAGAKLDTETETIIRAGCYLTHDSQMYHNIHDRLLERSSVARQLGEGLRPALEIWAHVQSRPDPELVVLTAGRRDAGFDAGLPVPQAWYRPDEHKQPQPMPAEHTTVDMHDQHLMLNVPADSPLAIGDAAAFGISHPCTTFDKWQLIPVVDDDYNVTSALHTFF